MSPGMIISLRRTSALAGSTKVLRFASANSDVSQRVQPFRATT